MKVITDSGRVCKKVLSFDQTLLKDQFWSKIKFSKYLFVCLND